MDRLELRRRLRVLLPYAVLWLGLGATLAAFTAYELRSDRRHALNAARADVATAAALLRAQAAQTLDGAEGALEAAGAIHDLRLTSEPPAVVLSAFRRDRSVDSPITAFDRDGRFVASSAPTPPAADVSIADRAYFIDARAHSGIDMQIGAPTIGPVSGRVAIPLVRRLQTPDGAFDGVLVAAIDPERLLQIDPPVRLGASSRVGLVRRDGLVFARSISPSFTSRAGMIDPALQTALRSVDVAPVFRKTALHGVPALLALQPVPRTALVAFAAVDESDALAHHARFARQLIGFALLTLAVLTISIGLAGRRALGQVHRHRQLEVRYEKERKRARSDPLTGVANRAAFDDHLRRCNAALAQDSKPFVLAFIDLDRFKALNDTLGHAAGDDALRRVARTLLSSVREADLVARLGGDEFAVLLPGLDGDNAPRVCGKLHAGLLAAAAGADLRIGFSIGVVAFEQAPAESRAMTALADRLMYDVKSAGGGGVRYGVYRHDGLHLEGSHPGGAEPDGLQRNDRMAA